jgi:hypothetical protein
MPTPQIQADDVADRILTPERHERAIDPRLSAGPIPIPTVKDLVLVDDNGLADAVTLDVLNK